MADSTPQRRVLPARERRESAAKRMASSPPPAPTPPAKKPTPAKSGPGSRGPRGPYKKRAPVDTVQTPTRRPSSPVIPIDESVGFPTKVNENQPLPTSNEPQPEKLSLGEYQSIADSAVLAASLHRSRTKWLLEGLFERYWTKPSKRKGAPEIHNPDVKSMTKLGPCTITIEPHSFEAILYTVREPHPPPMYRPPPFPHANAAPPAYPPYYGSSHNTTSRPPVPPSVAKPIHPQNHPPSSSGLQANLATRPALTEANGGRNGRAASPKDTSPLKDESLGPAPTSNSDKPGPRRPDAPAASPKGSADPVIQALATRAATDPELKDLMKHVATSQATQEQLRKFQEHIDELNALIKNNQDPEKGKQNEPTPILATAAQPNQPTAAKPAETPSRTSTPSSAVAPANPTPPLSTAPPLGPPRPSPPYPSYPPRANPPYSVYPPFPPPKPEPRVKHMIIEFTSPLASTTAASPDRFHLPEYCVLEFLPPPTPGPPVEMLCSFLVVRPGSWTLGRGGDPKFYKKGEEYFESVTMRVNAASPRTLETWGKSARTLREVREWMENVVKTKKRAKQGYLVTRLPREQQGSGESEVAVSGGIRKLDREKDKEREKGREEQENTVLDGDTITVDADEDDELKDRYDMPYIR